MPFQACDQYGAAATGGASLLNRVPAPRRRFARLAFLITALVCTATLPARAEDAITTFSLSQNGGEIGLLSPYRHGLINDLQINHLSDLNMITPNITITKQWGSLRGWQFSSTHEFNYPILYLGTCPAGCSLLSNSGQLPQLVNLNSQFYFRRQLSEGITVTPSFGVEMNSGGFSPSELNQLGQLYNPFRSGYSINTGIDINGNFDSNWGYAADLEYFSMSGLSGDSAWAHKAMLYYEWKKNQRIAFGYKYSTGFGNYELDAHAYPMVDFLWKWD